MRRPLALLALVCVLLLAGCATIPTSGPVFENRAAAPGDESLVFQPNPPAVGADQVDIVRGFVQAASEGGSYSVAKQFLTPDFAKRWRPAARVLVHTTGWTTRQAADGRVVLTVPLSARVDADGAYTPTSVRSTLDFQLQQVGGQWRISATPDGIVLSQDVFQRSFVQRVLRFFDASVGRLVPDRRWFPKRDDQDSAVVRALIAGPSDPLADVVSQVFPEGTELSTRVTGDAGTRTVVLQTSGVAPSAEQFTRMQQEIASSLPVTTAGLRLVVDGRVVSRAPQLQAPQPDARPIVLAGGRFGPLTASGVQQEGDLAKRIVAAKPRAITVSARQRLAAVLTSRGVEAVGDTATRLVDPRADLVAPSLDQLGWIFSVPADDPSGLIAVNARGTASTIASGLPGTVIRTIEVSPDGTRLLVVAEDGDSAIAQVLGIVRSADGTPVALSSAFYPVSPAGSPVTTGTWVDDDRVALLAPAPDQQSVLIVQLGGFASDEGRLSDAELLAGNTGVDTVTLRAQAASGGLFERQGNAWTAVSGGSDVSVLAIQR